VMETRAGAEQRAVLSDSIACSWAETYSKGAFFRRSLNIGSARTVKP
jgi:hypothetical protein